MKRREGMNSDKSTEIGEPIIDKLRSDLNNRTMLSSFGEFARLFSNFLNMTEFESTGNPK